MKYRELLLGCGHSREKRLFPVVDSPFVPGVRAPIREWVNLKTADVNPRCKPDVLFDLNQPYDICGHFPDDWFDEIHAYEVLEHAGAQGDYELFFKQFNALWSIMKPNGVLCATVPNWTSIWAWGDPGHTRVISPATLVFLDQEEYAKQLGKTAMSDYRAQLGETNFKRVDVGVKGDNFNFILQAIK